MQAKQLGTQARTHQVVQNKSRQAALQKVRQSQAAQQAVALDAQIKALQARSDAIKSAQQVTEAKADDNDSDDDAKVPAPAKAAVPAATVTFTPRPAGAKNTVSLSKFIGTATSQPAHTTRL